MCDAILSFTAHRSTSMLRPNSRNFLVHAQNSAGHGPRTGGRWPFALVALGAYWPPSHSAFKNACGFLFPQNGEVVLDGV